MRRREHLPKTVRPDGGARIRIMHPRFPSTLSAVDSVKYPWEASVGLKGQR